MKNFAKQWVDPVFQFTSLLFIIILHLALIVGITVGLAVTDWMIGLVVGMNVLFLCYLFLIFIWFANRR